MSAQLLKNSQISAPARHASSGRRGLVVMARGPVVTKRGVAFGKTERMPGSKKPNQPGPSEDEEIGALGYGAIAAGAVANPITLWSAYTLKTTGAGLQGDLLGAAEGVSYLVILGLIGWSVYTKTTTGKGLPAGPAGLLGAVEGFSYLSLLAAILAFALKA
uniref:Uncharacterized protein n=1 Tax=Dunaliella tertiolecta TaxID=3047 RepID=A0A7S3QVZ4_DUNTE|mmetsp:Transcript_1651/g.4094  ORF Transcript_1651/g.4094 Transcript_1651/m.4094 type:complete len:161 (+) Transcript_1651:1874-2356(+)|eukprot:CAMPEP_0202367260 /NCGR_PEP_ID=MMETSP1126-20121109/17549_1 /ASSEMBLY_ACC=CAM_ASM_000457 /TAXON_ID=3047 /ORGANISM="Dunaliella tertiolecta, Strain CCMP1320" /LENGTH=160 /DNA_ID=CAMNT_0048962487 /DNA_START=1784 /DNA_END=2266 /DNA_ORIENTATION=-